MQHHRRRFLLLLLALVLVALPFISAGSLHAAPAASTPGSVTVTFEPGEYDLKTSIDGSSIIAIDGYAQVGQPGEPLLPERVFNVALPPGVNPETVRLEVTDWQRESLTGKYHPALAVPRHHIGRRSGGKHPKTAIRPLSTRSRPVVYRWCLRGQLRKWRFRSPEIFAHPLLARYRESGYRHPSDSAVKLRSSTGKPGGGGLSRHTGGRGGGRTAL